VPRESFERRHRFYSCGPRNSRRDVSMCTLRATRIYIYIYMLVHTWCVFVSVDCSFIFSRDQQIVRRNVVANASPATKPAFLYDVRRFTIPAPALATFSIPHRKGKVHNHRDSIEHLSAFTRWSHSCIFLMCEAVYSN